MKNAFKHFTKRKLTKLKFNFLYSRERTASKINSLSDFNADLLSSRLFMCTQSSFSPLHILIVSFWTVWKYSDLYKWGGYESSSISDFVFSNRILRYSLGSLRMKHVNRHKASLPYIYLTIQLLDNERSVWRLKRLQAVWTSVVRVRVSVNSDMGATTMCSRHQMLEHTGGRSHRSLVSVVV
jgi:hypothetical protein